MIRTFWRKLAGGSRSTSKPRRRSSPLRLEELEARATPAAFLGNTAAWMGQLPGQMLVSELSIPGTHDTMTCGFSGVVSVSAKTQDMNLQQQLSAGVRFLDIRGGPLDTSSGVVQNDLGVYHGIYQVPGQTFAQSVVAVCRQFLAQHPSETIVLSVKNEFPGFGAKSKMDDAAFAATVERICGQDPNLWYVGNTVPSLNQVRGKIVLLRRFNDSARSDFGIDASGWADNSPDSTQTLTFPNGTTGSLRVQDEYAPASGHVADKEQAIAEMLKNAVGETAAPHGGNTWFVNFASAAGAWPLLMPDDWASHVDPWLSTQLDSFHAGRVGTVVLDFPKDSPQLIDKIIGANWPFATVSAPAGYYGGTAQVMLHALEGGQTVTFNVDPKLATVGPVTQSTAMGPDGRLDFRYAATITFNAAASSQISSTIEEATSSQGTTPSNVIGTTAIQPHIDGQPTPSPYPMLMVLPDKTDLTITPSDTKPTYSESLKFTATVHNGSVRGVFPTGKVQFTLDGKNLGDPIALDTSGKAVSAAVNTLTPGKHNLRAVFTNSDGHFVASSGGADVLIRQLPTGVLLSASDDHPVIGGRETFTAKVLNLRPSGPFSADLVPTDRVQFKLDGQTLGAPVTLDKNGIATVTVSNLNVGNHVITADFTNLDGDFQKSQARYPLRLTVVPGEAVVVVQSSSPSAVVGDKVTLTATVSAKASGSAVVPRGTVTFWDGSTRLGSATLIGGVATLSTPSLKAGKHSIVAVYQGDGNFVRKTSAALAVPVAEPPPPS